MSIAYLPLDDRPCNKDFPVLLAKIANINLKVATDKTECKRFLNSSEYSILSIDRWVYGGLVESRKPDLTLQEAQKHMRDLQQILLKRDHEASAFSVLMREAPTVLSDDELKQAELIKKDYLRTRKRNLEINKKAIEFAKKGDFSFLALAMDDFSPKGFTVTESRELGALIRAEKLSNKVHILPGADETAMFLFAREFLASHRLSPIIYPFYSHAEPDKFLLRYEALPLTKLLKRQLNLLGARMAHHPKEADLFLFVHSPQEDQLDVPLEAPSPRFSYRWIKMLQSFLVREKPCILADVRFANGADASFMRALGSMAPVKSLFGFSAWNTTANALGMALSQGVVRWGAERTSRFSLEAHEHLLSLRILEDWVYQAEIRPPLVQRIRKDGKSALRLDDRTAKELSRAVTEKLNQFIHTYLPKHFPGLKVTGVSFPWNRLFDIRIDFKTTCHSEAAKRPKNL